LIQRIYQHCAEESWLKPGETVLDPFGGIAAGAFDALAAGYRWLGVELEQNFTDMGQGCDCTGISKAAWVRFYSRWDRMRYAEGHYWCPRCMVQVSVITGERTATNRTWTTQPRDGRPVKKRTRPFRALPFPDRKDKYRPVRAVTQSLLDMASVSYARGSGSIPHSAPHHYQGNIERWASQGLTGARLIRGDSRRLGEILREQVGACDASPPFQGILESKDTHFQALVRPGRTNQCSDYGTTEGQLGALPPGTLDACLASPPHCHGLGKEHTYADHAKRDRDSHRAIMREKGIADPDYGTHPVQLGNLPAGQVECAISSPPWEDARQNTTPSRRGSTAPTKHDPEAFGNSPAQLANESATTFWQASKQILQQVFDLLKPNGVAIFVTKRYIRDGVYVEFSQDWAKLCQFVGFQWLHHHHALLVEAHGTQGGLAGIRADMTHETWRISFFRRIAQRKGAPVIAWEDVLCFRKPADSAGGTIAACCASPPYAGAGEVLNPHNGIDWRKASAQTGQILTPGRAMQPYGTTLGQLGAMTPGSLDLCLSSPPYAGSQIAACEGNIGGGPGGRKESALHPVSENRKSVGYGANPAQLGSMREGPRPSPEETTP